MRDLLIFFLVSGLTSSIAFAADDRPSVEPGIEKKSIPNYENTYWFVGGIGASKLTVDQEMAGGADLSYNDTAVPALLLNGGMKISKKWGAELGIRYLSKNAESSTLSVAKNDFQWSSYSIEALWFLNNNQIHQNWNLRFGLQNNHIPLMIPFAGAINLEQGKLTAISFGFDYSKSINNKLKFEGLARYLYPLSSDGGGGDFDVDPQIGFDASVGLSTKVWSSGWVGVHWYNQFYKFKFDQAYALGAVTDGKSTLWQSALDLRLAVNF